MGFFCFRHQNLTKKDTSPWCFFGQYTAPNVITCLFSIFFSKFPPQRMQTFKLFSKFFSPKLGVHNIKQDLARSCFQLWPPQLPPKDANSNWKPDLARSWLKLKSMVYLFWSLEEHYAGREKVRPPLFNFDCVFPPWKLSIEHWRAR